MRTLPIETTCIAFPFAVFCEFTLRRGVTGQSREKTHFAPPQAWGPGNPGNPWDEGGEEWSSGGKEAARRRSEDSEEE
eukprot:3052259-Pyramimonas_sp.AAC.2